MKMTRHFFISDDLDDLEHMEEELERNGVVTPQIHVLTLDDGGADNRVHLHQVASFMKQDIIHSTMLGAVTGACVAILVLLIAYLTGWTQTPAGWLPFIFLAIIALGFFTWEGGLWGIQEPNKRFRNFERVLQNGRHVFFVDLEPGQGEIIEEIARNHPRLETAGTGRASPHWLVICQHRVKHFFTHTFP